jgi:hypothetical protein
MPTWLHGELGARLPPLRLVSRHTQEYAGACPFCGGDERRSDRFHVWLLPVGRERYWCRRCNRKGRASDLYGGRHRERRDAPPPARLRQTGPVPHVAHIPFYRRLYALVAAWAETNLQQSWNPRPRDYLRQRGFDREAIRWARLGYALDDPHSLVDYLRRQAPDLLPYAEAAGLLVRDDDGTLSTHWHLRGRIVIPYLSQGQVYDLRTRRLPGAGSGTRTYASLPGSYAWRGAILPLCWDAANANEVVIITEGEFKALAATAAHRIGALPYPTISHPGLSYFRREWPTLLSRRGTRVAILAYDARATRPTDDDGNEQLSPEETWTLRHGLSLAHAGLQVLVLNLPLEPGRRKEDLDSFLLRHGPAALTWLLHTTVQPLRAYAAQLPQPLLRAAGLASLVRSS